MSIISGLRSLRLTQTVQVLGASDPTSGTVSLNEVVRGLGALYKKGWRPHRTILIAGWDGEEVWLFCPPPKTVNVEYLSAYSTVSSGARNGARILHIGYRSTLLLISTLVSVPSPPPSKHVAE